MKETRYRPDPKQPYGLHDRRVSAMTLKEGDLILSFEDGFTRMAPSGTAESDVPGCIVAEGIDPDFCYVAIEGQGGSMGEFRGERFAILDFTEKYRGFRFEIINEYYGWQRLLFTGWLWMPGARPKEMTLCLGYFTGDVVYRTEE